MREGELSEALVKISNSKKKSHSALDTIYLCNFRVSVDGDWLCLRQLDDVEVPKTKSIYEAIGTAQSHHPISSSTNRRHLDFLPNFYYDPEPSQVEKSNLLNITKLVIKELLEWSVRHGRILEADHPPLQHFFIVLEHAMRHGLKPKKGLLGPKKELWDVLQVVEKYTNEALDITSTVRDLPTVSTHTGRARAWLKLAFMQKKLGDYFRILLERREEELREFYEPIALLMSDDAIILSGLLLGLNIIDCNFCLKDENLDTQQGVIDFSLYLRSAQSGDASEATSPEQKNMDSVLDQKNYIEELNRHLNATCTHLQSRVEALTTTNALMKEDLVISKTALTTLTQENILLRLRLASTTENEENRKGLTDSEGIPEKLEVEQSLLKASSLEKQPLESMGQQSDIAKQLEIQISLKNEMSEAMSILEREVHEKQETIISLRKQLDEIKVINLEMYKKLQESEKTLKYKSDYAIKVESKASMLAETVEKLGQKISVQEAELKSCHETMRSLGTELADKVLKVSTLEGDLRVEREWRQSLQNTLVKDKEKISELNMELQKLHLIDSELERVQNENRRLLNLVKDQDKTLEEIGGRLSESTLKVEELREAAKGDATWADDKNVTECMRCKTTFNLTKRKHHCRSCGKIFCKMCSDNSMLLASSSKPVRVCDECYTSLIQDRCGGGPKSPSS